MIGDPFLNNFALGLLLFVAVTLFYGVIAIHDIPYKIAERRKHPHQDAIHAAGWVSLFTLHALWPFLWIWAMAYRPERGWGFSHTAPVTSPEELESLRARVALLEKRMELQAPSAQPEPARSIDIDLAPKESVSIEPERS